MPSTRPVQKLQFVPCRIFNPGRRCRNRPGPPSHTSRHPSPPCRRPSLGCSVGISPGRTAPEILAVIPRFFGQESPIFRELFANVGESVLRFLREQLHVRVMQVIPATAGRSLMKWISGNVAKLADDCWALGSSVAQSALLRGTGAALRP